MAKRRIRWKDRLTIMMVQPVTLGEFIGREGLYFLNRKQGKQRVFSFKDLVLSLTRGHILGEKPPPNGYQSHPFDERSLEDAQELPLANFAKITTGLEGYGFPPTLNRSAIATLLVDSTPGGMMRAVVSCLLAAGVLLIPNWDQKGFSYEAFDNTRNMDRGIDETPIQEELQNPTTESVLYLIIAPVVTRKGKQRMLQSSHSPPLQESTAPTQEPPTPMTPPGEMPPPPTPVTPLSRTPTRKQKDQDTPDPMFPHLSDRHVGRHDP